MTYRPMRFDPAYRPFVSPLSVYVLPLAADPGRYRVLCPSGLRGKLLDLAIQDKLSLRTYAGCPGEAAAAVREELLRLCNRAADRYASRLNRLTVAGTALAVLGVVNVILPDPLPLADELLMTVGGAGMAYAGLTLRRKNLPPFRSKVEAAEAGLRRLASVEDVLLGRIFAAIRARTSPELLDPGAREVDLVEAEAAWLVEHLDLRSVLAQGAATSAQLKDLLEVIEDALPLRRIRTLDRRLRKDPGDRGARRSLDRLADRLGMSRDALTVYGEFARVAREVLAE